MKIFFLERFSLKIEGDFKFFTRGFPVKKNRASLARAAFRRVFLYNHGCEVMSDEVMK